MSDDEDDMEGQDNPDESQEQQSQDNQECDNDEDNSQATESNSKSSKKHKEGLFSKLGGAILKEVGADAGEMLGSMAGGVLGDVAGYLANNVCLDGEQIAEKVENLAKKSGEKLGAMAGKKVGEKAGQAVDKYISNVKRKMHMKNEIANESCQGEDNPAILSDDDGENNAGETFGGKAGDYEGKATEKGLGKVKKESRKSGGKTKANKTNGANSADEGENIKIEDHCKTRTSNQNFEKKNQSVSGGNPPTETGPQQNYVYIIQAGSQRLGNQVNSKQCSSCQQCLHHKMSCCAKCCVCLLIPTICLCWIPCASNCCKRLVCTNKHCNLYNKTSA